MVSDVVEVDFFLLGVFFEAATEFEGGTVLDFEVKNFVFDCGVESGGGSDLESFSDSFGEVDLALTGDSEGGCHCCE